MEQEISGHTAVAGTRLINEFEFGKFVHGLIDGAQVLQPQANQGEAVFTAQPKGNRILLVDDEIDMWWGLALKTLALAGYDVDVAEDGDEGWRALQAKPYDLLITDNRMPKVWGLELIQKLRSAAMELPVIFASSSLPVEELKQNAQLHIDTTVEKPITADELLHTVKQVLHEETQFAPGWYSAGPDYLAAAI